MRNETDRLGPLIAFLFFFVLFFSPKKFLVSSLWMCGIDNDRIVASASVQFTGGFYLARAETKCQLFCR